VAVRGAFEGGFGALLGGGCGGILGHGGAVGPLGDAWLHHGERYRLDRAKVRVDLDDLDQLLAAASDDGHEPAVLERALALWRGEPLEGSDFLWAEGERRNLHATLVDLLERVGRVRLAHGDVRAALQLAEQAIGLEELHEPSWRLALQKPNTLSACASQSPADTTNSHSP
jgi:two-component SAPR family response regulator